MPRHFGSVPLNETDYEDESFKRGVRTANFRLILYNHESYKIIAIPWAAVAEFIGMSSCLELKSTIWALFQPAA